MDRFLEMLAFSSGIFHAAQFLVIQLRGSAFIFLSYGTYYCSGVAEEPKGAKFVVQSNTDLLDETWL